MLYKVYNELPGVGTAAIPLISVILYNACNVMEWGTIQHVKAHTARTSTGRSGALLDALGGGPSGAGGGVRTSAYSTNKQKNGLQTNCSPSTLERLKHSV